MAESCDSPETERREQQGIHSRPTHGRSSPYTTGCPYPSLRCTEHGSMHETPSSTPEEVSSMFLVYSVTDVPGCFKWGTSSLAPGGLVHAFSSDLCSQSCRPPSHRMRSAAKPHFPYNASAPPLRSFVLRPIERHPLPVHEPSRTPEAAIPPPGVVPHGRQRYLQVLPQEPRSTQSSGNGIVHTQGLFPLRRRPGRTRFPRPLRAWPSMRESPHPRGSIVPDDHGRRRRDARAHQGLSLSPLESPGPLSCWWSPMRMKTYRTPSLRRVGCGLVL
jgi:hypothetical protein